MKKRISFVTNSSSSSFIGAFAKISDMEKAQKVTVTIGDNLETLTGSDILKRMSGEYFWGFGADWVGCNFTPNKNAIEPDAVYVLWESYGGAGDSDDDFIVRDDNGDFIEYDYDVYLSSFRERDQEIYNAISEQNGFTNIRNGYGAGRDG